jgi:hypothetical protein
MGLGNMTADGRQYKVQTLSPVEALLVCAKDRTTDFMIGGVVEHLPL